MADQKITSVLDMSDEDIMNLDPSTLSTEPAQPGEGAAAEGGESDEDKAAREAAEQEAAAAAEAAEAEAKANNNGDADGNNQGEAQGKANGAEAGEGDGSTSNPADGADAAAQAAATKDPKAAPGKSADAKPAGTPPAAAAPGSADDLKSFQEKILAPFKANGRDMQVRDADEAIALMQKGAGFHKRMEQLKPNLAIIESLRRADLLDQSKIDFLIDVMAKKPEAISKLVQESGIDPLDISPEKAGAYKPTSYKPTDRQLAIDEVLSELHGSKGFDRTVDVVAKQWDNASRDFISDSPAVLRVLNNHMENGVYDLIAAEVERERTIGHLTGLSDLEAYRQVGDAMEAAGKFAPKKEPAGQPNPSGQQAPAVPPVVKPNPKQADDSDRNAAKRAASPARATSAPVKGKMNYLAMSDDEIMKLG